MSSNNNTNFNDKNNSRNVKNVNVKPTLDTKHHTKKYFNPKSITRTSSAPPKQEVNKSKVGYIHGNTQKIDPQYLPPDLLVNNNYMGYNMANMNQSFLQQQQQLHLMQQVQVPPLNPNQVQMNIQQLNSYQRQMLGVNPIIPNIYGPMSNGLPPNLSANMQMPLPLTPKGKMINSMMSPKSSDTTNNPNIISTSAETSTYVKKKRQPLAIMDGDKDVVAEVEKEQEQLRKQKQKEQEEKEKKEKKRENQKKKSKQL